MTNLPIKSYVYENNEIIKTGRVAQRSLRGGKVDELIEITPKDSSVGSWKKWVRETDLYEVAVSATLFSSVN